MADTAQILIIEDDHTLGKSIQEALSRAGYEARWLQDPDRALSTAKTTTFQVVICDCMLPKYNGVDLITQMQQEALDDFAVILVSGIFRDDSFQKNAINKTNAVQFLLKPIKVQELVNTVNELVTPSLDTESTQFSLYSLISQKDLTPQQVIQVIHSHENLHGFDIPAIVSLLIKSGFTGQTDIQSTSGQTCHLHFHEGKIIHIDSNDNTSYFGLLLVEKGFVSADEVQKNLELDDSKPIGKRLIDANSLSPHAIKIICEEQMGLRLSKAIQDHRIEVTVQETQIAPQDAAVTREDLTPMLADWLSSKIKSSWLHSLYLNWEDYILRMPKKGGKHFETLKKFPILENVPNIKELVSSDNTIQEATESSQAENDEDTLKALHFLLVEGCVTLDAPEEKTQVAFDKQLRRARKVAEKIEKQNHFEVLGLSMDARSQEIETAYMDLAKLFHPDKLPPEAPEELKTHTHNIFSAITEAHNILKDPDERQKYIKTLQKGDADELLEAEAQFEQAKNHLNQKKYQEAIDILKQLVDSKSERSRYRIHLNWARLKQGFPQTKEERYIRQISQEMAQIPPEDRHSAEFHFVKGLLYGKRAEGEKAVRAFKKALALDPQFLEAKQQLTMYKSKPATDLTTVFTKFFKKK